MTLALEKPAPRGPKPRTRIARGAPPRRSCRPIARRARPRQIRRTETAALVREADRLFSKLVLRVPVCRNCGKRATDTAHHISRRYTATRWNLDNASPLCRRCHDGFTADPDLWEETWRRWVGFNVAARLTALAISGARKTEAWMYLIVAGLKAVAVEFKQET